MVAGAVGGAGALRRRAPTLTSSLPRDGAGHAPPAAHHDHVPHGLGAVRAGAVQGRGPSPSAGGASTPDSTPAVTHAVARAPPLPSGAVGQPARIEQTGTLGLCGRPR